MPKNIVGNLLTKTGRTVFSLIKNSSRSAGLPPGTMMYTGKKKDEPVTIDLIDYDPEKVTEKTIEKMEESLQYTSGSTVTWVNVNGIHRTGIVEAAGRLFGLHPLTQEDIVNTNQRPKLEDFDDYHFLILKMITCTPDNAELKREQVSLVVAQNFVISFQEEKGDVFDPIRERIRQNLGRIRKMGNDYLAYCLLDAVVDHYFVVLENLGDTLEKLDAEVRQDPTDQALQDIHRVKRDLAILRKSVWPLREVVNSLVRGESKLIKKATALYLRDVYDHTIQVIETLESFRDMASGLLDLYMTMVSNRMNETMKVLTIIATIFIPLTFIAGIYGMNFEFMPELKLKWAYPVVWLVMGGLAAVMVIYFKRKKWL